MLSKAFSTDKKYTHAQPALSAIETYQEGEYNLLSN